MITSLMNGFWSGNPGKLRYGQAKKASKEKAEYKKIRKALAM